MKNNSRIIKYMLCVLILPTMLVGASSKLTIIDGSNSNYEIICVDNGTASATEGAKEMQSLIKLSTGVELPITTTLSAGKHAIVIGAHPLAKAAVVSAESMKKDGFIIKVIGKDLFLVGDDKDIRGLFAWSPFIESSHAGSYFAVMQFARRFLGVEWYMPGDKGMEWKTLKNLTIPADLMIKEEPRFVRRMIEGAWINSDRRQQSLLKSGHIKKNYYRKDIAKECEVWGRHMLLGNGKVVQFQHAWYMFMPAEKANRWAPQAYGKKHPEYFALVNGKRVTHYTNKRHGGQICLSNSDMIKTYADNIIRYGKKTGSKAFSLAQNDGGGQCQCESCMAMDGIDPVTGERVLSDRLLYFSSKIAKQVVEEIPDARLGMSAYGVTRHPPVADHEPHNNVFISDVYNMLPNLWHSGPKERERIIRDLTTWREQAAHVALTSYYNIYGNWSLPWDTTDVIGEIIKIIAKYDSSDGMLMNNCRYFGLAPGVDGARLWVLSRLLWNPDQSAEKLQKQFYRGAFGEKAGPFIEEYFNTINKSMIQVMNENPMDWKKPSGALECSYPIKAYLPIKEKCRMLIDNAVAATLKENERVAWRVDRVARGWEFTEVTIDAIRYAEIARTETYKDEGLTKTEAWERAINAGRARRTMVNDPESYYAIGQCSVDECLRQRPLGIVNKIPESINMKIHAPLIKQEAVIDGKLDEPFWKTLTATRNFTENRKGHKSIVTTWVKSYCTEDALILGYYCGEPNMNKLNTVDNPEDIWKGDVAEFYLSANGSNLDYIQFLVNPNSVGKAYFMRGDRGMDSDWNPEWEHKAYKAKDHWSVEMKIPFITLGLNSSEIKRKTPFVNFFRERYTQTQENSGWAPTLGGFAQPAKYGRIKFIN